MPASFQFKPLQETDYPLLLSWLAQPHVCAWYDIGAPLSLAAVQQKYLARIFGQEPVQCLIIFFDGVAIGFIQYYPGQKFTHMAAPLENFAGLDFYIGDPAYLHRDLGAAIVTQFLTEFVYQKFDACVVDPDSHNIAALRCFERAGFRKLEVHQAKVLMSIHKP